MANVKFIAVSRGLRGIVDYVTNREKTVEQLISGVNCVARTAVPEFEAVKKQFRKTEGRGYYHIVQAFAPDDPLDFATAHELGVKLAEHFKGYQCIVVTHMNTAHIHNHIIMNSASFETGMKFHQSAREMQQKYTTPENIRCRDSKLFDQTLTRENMELYTFLLIALQTGMRRGEIVGLQWSDIDFESRMIRVRHNAVLGRYETTVSELLKTKAGRRDIPMSDEVEAWLRKQRGRSSSKFVLSLKNKKVMTLSAFRSMWKLIERELPETHITAHILRHTYITRLFEAGLDVKEIQYLAGHSTMDMTLSVYTHYDRKNREQQTAEKVRRAFCKEAV